MICSCERLDLLYFKITTMAFKLLTSVKDGFLQLLFPIRCVVCERETENPPSSKLRRARKNKLICSDCLKNLTPSLNFYCLLCEAKSVDAGMCYSCKTIAGENGSFKIDKLIYPFSYREPAIQKIVKAFKYSFIKELTEPIGKLMINYLNKIGGEFSFNDYLIIPVPLHKRKYNWRGYNQSELVAQKISKYLNIGLAKNYLIKEKSTRDQVELKKDERLKNLDGAFKCSGSESISGRKILLVDDVYTTGTTMNECARVLKEAGAKEVIGLAIARG